MYFTSVGNIIDSSSTLSKPKPRENFLLSPQAYNLSSSLKANTRPEIAIIFFHLFTTLTWRPPKVNSDGAK